MKIDGWIFLALMLFWLVITESLYWDSLLVGACLSLLVVLFNRGNLAQPGEFPRLTLPRLRILLRHAGQMLVEMTKANIQVVRIVLSPRLKFRQGLVVFTPQLKYPWNEVLFANSVTLTPGTLTLDVEKDVYTVHILEMENADSLVSWSILDNLRRLEED